MEELLCLKNISYSYHTLQGEIPVLDSLNLTIHKGEFVAIIGPSGCGKSTLFSIIAGLLAPSVGEIIRPIPDATNQSSSIGYMLQRDHLLEWRTIYENAMLGLEINHRIHPDSIDFVNQLLKLYGLWEFRDKRPSQLSGGMKQRVALIRTLALNPCLLLLDEPFSALDYQTRITVSSDICNLIRSSHKTVLLITHDLSEAISLADRVIVLSKRPAHIIRDFEIKLTRQEASVLASRNAPEFNQYFNTLWGDLNEQTSNSMSIERTN